jgi:hypothetical protein
MMGDQPRQPWFGTSVSQPARAVERMEAGLCQSRRVADIMKVGSCHQQITVIARDHSRDPAGLFSSLPDMKPAVAKRRKKPVSLVTGP